MPARSFRFTVTVTAYFERLIDYASIRQAEELVEKARMIAGRQQPEKRAPVLLPPSPRLRRDKSRDWLGLPASWQQKRLSLVTG
jgi:hypothetical protein